MYTATSKTINLLYGSFNLQEIQSFKKDLHFFYKKAVSKNFDEAAGVERVLLEKNCSNLFLKYCTLIKNNDYRKFKGKDYYILNNDYFTWSK